MSYCYFYNSVDILINERIKKYQKPKKNCFVFRFWNYADKLHFRIDLETKKNDDVDFQNKEDNKICNDEIITGSLENLDISLSEEICLSKAKTFWNPMIKKMAIYASQYWKRYMFSDVRLKSHTGDQSGWIFVDCCGLMAGHSCGLYKPK